MGSTSISFLQANLNHSTGAQDAFLQSMLEWSIDAAVVSEPYYIPTRPNWVGDSEMTVAIVVPTGVRSSPLSLVARGEGYVAATWGDFVVLGIYLPPSKPLAEVERLLDEVGAVVRRESPRNSIILGDFNAKSVLWGSPATCPRGEVVQEWAAAFGLTLLNRGSASTCVRPQGESIVDLSFATPVASSRVVNWRVLEEVETLSDHSYIRFEVATTSGLELHRPAGNTTAFPRWSLAQLRRELALEASIVQAWTMRLEQPVVVQEEARRFRQSLWRICDASMPRVKRHPPKRQVYWWSPVIANLRESCVAARRQYTRQRRQRVSDPVLLQRLRDAYNATKKELQLEICRSKDQAREELLDGLNGDPWGRPYLVARNKLRAQAPPLTETLQPDVLSDVVAALFPDEAAHTAPAVVGVSHERDDEAENIPPVSLEEFRVSLQKLKAKKTAPGPDGVPGHVLALALGELAEWYVGILNACLEQGQFPSCWKEGRLVLLQKEGRPADSPSAYRPIVLLDDAGKLFERILAARIVNHLRSVGPDLADCQYGFRDERSTIDAISNLKDLSEEAVSGGGVLLAVSLDIANAFNSLPFEVIESAFRFHGLPTYIRRIIGSYLHGREISYVGRDGTLHRREMRCGVPQGSVLGPLLWNMGYDFVLRGALLTGLRVICYADDTLVAARGANFDEAARRAEVGVALVVRRIEMLGLRVALHKTEALLFHGPRARPPTGASLNICGTRVELKSRMKYLGLTLDSRWNFREHFRSLAPRLIGTSSALGRLLPNLGGPKAACRRLYTGVLRSMALYGAPVWADALSAENVALLYRVQRVMAVRAIRAYRTVSHEAACVLAGTPPWDLDARVLAEVYSQRARARDGGVAPPLEVVEGWRRSAHENTMRRWKRRLAEPRAGQRTVDAIRPLLKEWVDRRHGTLTFRLVQILSGHGSFGRYLCHTAGREPTTECHHCDCEDDTAQHTLAECPAWATERAHLCAEIGNDLSLPGVTRAMVDRERSWEAVASFCEAVVAQKEAAERGREEDPSSARIRRRRTGRRRRAYARLMPPQ